MNIKLALPQLPSVPGVFITGTDTDVGKTWVAAGLTAVLKEYRIRACYFKPIQSGCPMEAGGLILTDARLACGVAGLTEPLEVLTPVALRLPLAPGVAAMQAGVEVDLRQVAAAFQDLASRHEFLVVEGAGGLYVPLAGLHFMVLDLIRWLGLPLVVVAKSGLGTINHTVLTVKAALAADIKVAGVILNRWPQNPGLAEETNPGVIEALTGVPILGKLSEVADLEQARGREVFLAALRPVAEHIFKDYGTENR